MYGRAHPPFRRDDSGDYAGAAGVERGGGGGNASDSTDDQGARGDRRRPGAAGAGGGGGTGPNNGNNKKKMWRPTTLPHIDRRRRGDEEREAHEREHQQQQPRPKTIGPGVIVHAYEPPSEPLEDPIEMWIIRPRENSGKSKLNRRRKYDSYVGTLEVDRLKKLDEEVLREAATYDDLGGEDDDDDEDDDEDGDEERGDYRMARRRGEDSRGEEEAEEEIRQREERGRRRAAAKVVNVRRARSASPRRERLCEEVDDMNHDEEEEEECKNPPGLYNSRRYSRQDSTAPSYRPKSYNPHRQQHQPNEDEPPPPPPNRYSSRQTPNPRHSHRYPEPLDVDDDDDSMAPAAGPFTDSPTQQTSFFGPLPRVRFYRDGVTNNGNATAPPDDVTFHDLRGKPMDGGGGAPPRGGRRTSAELAAEAARAKDQGGTWLKGLDDDDDDEGRGSKNVGGGRGGKKRHHRRTMLDWLDRNQRFMSEGERTARAALYLHDAIDTRPPRHQSKGLLTVKAYNFSKGAVWTGIVVAASVVHLLLALWEPPRPLPNSYPYHDSLNRHTLRSAHETAQQLLGVETFLVMIYILDLVLEIFALGPADFFCVGAPPRVIDGMARAASWVSRTWSQVRFLVVVLFLMDVSANFQGGVAAHFSRALRPVFLICVCDPLKRWAVLLYKLLAQLRDVVICISIVLALFSLTGLILFSETSYYSGGLKFQNFGTFVNSVVALYVLLTTQNFSELLDPAYSADPRHSTPLYFFFFATFVVVLVLFLANLALPRVYWVFQSFQRSQAYQARTNERLALLLSFRCLDVEQRGYIDLKQFRDMLRYIRPEFFDAQTGYEKESCTGATDHLFLELAKDHPGRLYPSNYFNMCEVILMDFYPLAATMPRDFVSDECPGPQRLFFRDVIFSSRWAELLSLVLLLLTLFFLSFYGSPSIDKSQLRAYSYFIIALFTLEVMLKMWAFGTKAFFSRTENTIDAVVMGAAFTALMVYGCSDSTSAIRHSEQLANLPLLFLAFRGVRLFPKCDIFAKFQCAFTVLPFFFFSFVLSLLLVYSWAAIGMALFSGLTPRHQPTPSSSSGLAPALVAVNNFESFWSASITLFQVTATHDWYRTMYLWMDLSDTCWAALYFILFHAVANVVAIQLTTALFLDAFLSFDGKRWLEGAEKDDDDQAGAEGGGGKDKEGGVAGPTTDGPSGGGGGGVGDVDDYPDVVVPEAPEPLSENRDVEDVVLDNVRSRNRSKKALSVPQRLLNHPHIPHQPGVHGVGTPTTVIAPTGAHHSRKHISSMGQGGLYAATVV